jgi:hypothetical protein
MRKGRVGMQRNAAYNAFEGVAADVAAVSHEDLMEAAVKGRLAASLGCAAEKLTI